MSSDRRTMRLEINKEYWTKNGSVVRCLNILPVRYSKYRYIMYCKGEDSLYRVNEDGEALHAGDKLYIQSPMVNIDIVLGGEYNTKYGNKVKCIDVRENSAYCYIMYDTKRCKIYSVNDFGKAYDETLGSNLVDYWKGGK